MQDYFFIKEKLEKFDFNERLSRLSKKFKKKKIVIFGLNKSFKLLNSEYNIESYFNIIGITDFHLQIPEDDMPLRLVHIDNLYFCSADVIINFKENGTQIEKYLRSKRLIKKKTKFINIIDKSFINKCSDKIKLLKKVCSTYSVTKKFVPIVKDLITCNSDNIISMLNYKEKIAALVSKPDEPIRVMFFVFNYKQWTLSNLYYELRADKNFRVLPIVVLPDALTCDEYNSVDESLKYLNDNGYQCIEGVEKDTGKAVIVKALKPDIIIYQQPEYLKADYTPGCLSEFAVTCYIEPEFYIKKHDNSINAFIDNRLSNTWNLYTTNKYSLKNYKNRTISGCMFFEKYNQILPETSDIKWDMQNEHNYGKIIYSPSLVLNKNCNRNDFLEYQKKIFFFISSHLHYHFVSLPQKNLKKQCIDNDIFSEDEYSAYITNLTAFQDIPLNKNIDPVNLYMKSDLLITDNISTAIEYFPTGKPVIYIDLGQENNLNEIGRKLFKTFYVVSSIDTMSIVLDDLLSANHDYNLKKRYSILGKYSDEFNPKASILIKNELKALFNRIDSDNSNNVQSELKTDEITEPEEVNS